MWEALYIVHTRDVQVTQPINVASGWEAGTSQSTITKLCGWVLVGLQHTIAVARAARIDGAAVAARRARRGALQAAQGRERLFERGPLCVHLAQCVARLGISENVT